MVTASLILGLALVSGAPPAWTGAAPAVPAGQFQAGGEIHRVLAKERFPWYDARNDRVKPVLPAPDFGGGPWKSWGRWLSDLFEPLGRFFRRLNGWRLPGVGGQEVNQAERPSIDHVE